MHAVDKELMWEVEVKVGWTECMTMHQGYNPVLSSMGATEIVERMRETDRNKGLCSYKTSD